MFESKTNKINVKKINDDCVRLDFTSYDDFLEAQFCDTSYYAKEYIKYRPDRYSQPKEEFVLERVFYAKSNIAPFNQFKEKNPTAYERAVKQDKDPAFKRYQQYDKHLAGNIFNQIFGSKVEVQSKELTSNRSIYFDSRNPSLQVCPDGFVEVENKRYVVYCFRDDASKVYLDNKMSIKDLKANKHNFQLMKGFYDFALLNKMGEKVDGVYFCKVNRPDFFRSMRYHSPRIEEDIELCLVDVDESERERLIHECFMEAHNHSIETKTFAMKMLGDSRFNLDEEINNVINKKLEGVSFAKLEKKNTKEKENVR